MLNFSEWSRPQDEAKEAYRLRIQKAGVLPTPARLDESLFLLARGEVAAALPTSAHPEDAPAVRSMLYGYGFDFRGGHITQVVFDVADDAYIDLEAHLAAAMARD